MSLIKRIKAGEGTPSQRRKILEMLQSWKSGPQTEQSTTEDATSESTDVDESPSFDFGYPKKKGKR
jgi:hypothetical protein